MQAMNWLSSPCSNVTRAPPTPAAASIDAEVFRDVVRKLTTGTSSGPSGWTYEMIHDILMQHEDSFHCAHKFVNQILAGTMPRLENFLACRLVAMQKGDAWPKLDKAEVPTVRPIAVPEAWARLTSLCALATVNGIGATLLPHQFAVGIPGGAQIMGHALRQNSQRPDTVTVQLDLDNAFNAMSRGAMLTAIAARAPSLLPYAEYMYSEATKLYISGAWEGHEPIASCEGVRQGDPCAPLFFSLCIQDVLEHAALATDHRSPMPMISPCKAPQTQSSPQSRPFSLGCHSDGCASTLRNAESTALTPISPTR